MSYVHVQCPLVRDSSYQIEVVHMPLAERRYGEMIRAIERGSKS
ncbi:MAG: hypothetical protein WAM05_06365 [Candidatus Binataceae bacterium]